MKTFLKLGWVVVIGGRMNIKIKRENNDGVMRVESAGVIKEVLINEDIFHPENEAIALCFRGKQSSGIVELTVDEFDRLYKTVKNKIHLIKGSVKL